MRPVEMPGLYQSALWLVVCLLITSQLQAHSPPEHARVFFVGLADGDRRTTPLQVRFGIEGFGITPAGTRGKVRHTAGHFHLLIDLDRLPDLDEPVPRDDRHLHFDQGQMEAVISLPPGEHTLQLLLGDEDHEPHDPPLFSERIRVWITE